ncbi:MAG: hypothetical protein JW941_02690 [Candidatus Coatesbacteria bacterium]|nr:hypothetical protein [Candidatus Coatesbacteria bacterium]
MRLRDIVEAVGASVLAGEDCLPEREITTVSACDLMSDVLAFAKPGILLVTGLVNSQVIRTAAIAHLSGVIFVRGKQPNTETVELAKKMKVPLLSSRMHMFELCSELSKIGLRGTRTE